MRKITQTAIGLLATVGGVTHVAAQPSTLGYVDYALASRPSIPALSDAMLVGLGLLLAVMAYRTLRHHAGGKPLASIAALAIAGASLVSGVKLIEEAHAGTPGFQIPINAVSGTVTINSGGEVPLVNNSGQIQQIINVRGEGSCAPVSTTGTPQCTAGLLLGVGATCYLRFECGGT